MNYAALIKAIRTATTQLQGRAAAALNQALVIRNWMAGAWIVEFEQSGKDRAKYGARLLETLGRDLKVRGLKGLDERSLLDCRSVYRLYPQIPGTLSPEFKELLKIRKTASAPAQHSRALAIRGTLSRELPTPLEPALLDHLQHFLLELGRGFCFEARKSNSPPPAWIKSCSSRAISLRCRRWRNCARFSKQTASGLKASCLRLAAQPGL